MGIQKIRRLFSNRWFLIAISGLMMFCLFTLPYFFLSSDIVTSMSYDYGFNNKVGVLLTGISILLFVFFGLLNEAQEIRLFGQEENGVAWKLFVIGCLVVAFYALFMGIISGYRLAFNGGESSYFLPHIFDLVNGRVAYIDFLFFYGPLMIYFPYWVYVITFGSSVLWAYLFSVSLFHILGLYMFYELLNAMNFDCKTKKWIFCFVYICFFPIALGMNYEMLRFILPFWCFYKLHQNTSKWRMLFFPLSVILCMAISPEIGLVYLIALLIYCFLRFYALRDSAYISLATLSLILTICFMVIYQPMFSMLFSFSSGLLNFPFIPSWHLFLFFACVMLVAFILGCKLCNLSKNHFDITIIMMAFGLIPACLGRCDPGHVIYNGLFIFLISILWAIHKKDGCKKILLPLGFFSALLLHSYAFLDIIVKYVFEKDSTSVSEFTIPSFLPHDQKMAMPFNFNKQLIQTLEEESLLESLYIKRMDLSGDRKNVNITIDELKLKNPRYLLLYDGWEKIIMPNNYSLVAKYLFLTYYPIIPRRNGNLVFKPLVDYIKQNYHLAKQSDNVLLYERN